MTNLNIPYIYRIKCNTCNSFIYKEGLIPEFVCSIDNNHNIEPNYVLTLPDEGMQSFCKMDYKKHRKLLIDEVISSGVAMDSTRLYYASANFCTPIEVRNLFFSYEDQVTLGQLFHQRATESRKLRFAKAQAYLYANLNLQDVFSIAIETSSLVSYYVDYGIEGTSEGDCEGLFDYITSTSGTSFETTGFTTKTFSPILENITLLEIGNNFLNILKGLD